VPHALKPQINASSDQINRAEQATLGFDFHQGTSEQTDHMADTLMNRAIILEFCGYCA